MPINRFGRPGLIRTAARTAVIAGTAQAATGTVARRQQERAARDAPPPDRVYAAPPAASSADTDLVSQLERLGRLHAAGVLSDADFAAAKARLLG